MKRRAYGLILLIEAILCAVAVFLQIGPGRFYWEAISFPFVQAGDILRRLSLSGAAGNTAAVFLYAAIGLLPILCLLYRLYRKRAYWGDCLLGILSVLLFFGLYLYINPALFGKFMPMTGMAKGGRLTVSSCIWAALAGYMVLRVLHSFESCERDEKKIRQLIFLLRCVGAILVFDLCFIGLGSGMEALAKLTQSNTGAAAEQLRTTGFVIVLRFFSDAAAAALELWMLFCGERLLEALAADRYSEEAGRRAHRLYGVCRITVYVNVLGCVCLNLLQMLLGKLLLSADYLVQVPLGRIVLTLAVMLAAGYLAEGRRLKQENDLFI